MGERTHKELYTDKSWLENSWYVAAVSKRVPKGKLVRQQIAGIQMVLGRAKDGRAFALLDRCPHRGAPLSAGSLMEQGDATCIACPYHGWRFSLQDGKCLEVPALSEHDDAKGSVDAIYVDAFSTREQNGLLWVFIPSVETQKAARVEREFTPSVPLPDIDLPDGMSPKSVTIIDAPGPHIEAVTGLVDPAHTPFVHQKWWWRKGSAAQEKIKHYEMLPQGFRIPAHEPSSNSLIYKMLGGRPTTQIDFLLPGVRVETIRIGSKIIIGLTAITPIDERSNRIIHILYWNVLSLTLITPVVNAMASGFLKQDGQILALQAKNVHEAPLSPLFLGEPDVPAQWLHLMNRAWREQMGREQMDSKKPGLYKNPVSPKSLHWKT